MSHTPEEINELLKTQQHLVFQNDAARNSTVEYMKKCFQFNDSGIDRVDSLSNNKCDRELIGHLIGLLTQNINTLQEQELKRDQEITNLKHDLKVQRDKNTAISTVMTRCGLSAAIRNCEILNAAVQLVKEDGFDKLEAAVRCFGSQELTSSLDNMVTSLDFKDDGTDTGTDMDAVTQSKSESPGVLQMIESVSPPTKRLRRASVDDESVVGSVPPSESDLELESNLKDAFSAPEFAQPHVTSLPANSVQLYYQLVAQQEIHRQLLFNQTQRTNSFSYNPTRIQY